MGWGEDGLNVSYYLATADKITTRYQCDDGGLELTLFKNGDISMTSDSELPIPLNIYYYNGHVQISKDLILDTNIPGQGNLLLQQSASGTAGAVSNAIQSVIMLLLQ